VLDTYWSYLTHGAVDITSVISPQAPDLRARAQRLGGDPPDTEMVTRMGGEVTLMGSGDGQRQDTPGDEPPRAGRSRSPRPRTYIPSTTRSVSSTDWSTAVGTQASSPKGTEVTWTCHEGAWGCQGCGIVVYPASEKAAHRCHVSPLVPVGTPSGARTRPPGVGPDAGGCAAGVRHSFGCWPVEAVVPAATRCACGETVRGDVPRGTGRA